MRPVLGKRPRVRCRALPLPAACRLRPTSEPPGPLSLPATRVAAAEYFSQFGKVSKVRLSRSKTSGKSKHYAFLEFSSPEVARIVADATDGYMLFSQKLQSRVLSKDEVHEDLFKGANRVFKKVGAAHACGQHRLPHAPTAGALRALAAAGRGARGTTWAQPFHTKLMALAHEWLLPYWHTDEQLPG